MAAVNALEQAASIELLITSVHFPPGQPNGISLALMLRNRRPTVKILFVGPLDTDRLVGGLGALVPTPATAEAIVDRAKAMLE